MGILKGERRNVNKGAEGDTTRKTKTFSKPVRSGPIFLERNFFLAFSSNVNHVRYFNADGELVFNGRIPSFLVVMWEKSPICAAKCFKSW